MKCAKRDSGYLTEECRKIGQPDASKLTYVGYHAEPEASGRVRTMFLPIAESNYGDGWRLERALRD